MKLYLETIEKINKIIFSNGLLKEALKTVIPLTTKLHTDEHVRAETGKIVMQNLKILPPEFIRLFDTLLCYNITQENGNKLKTMYSIKISDFIEKEANGKTKAIIEHLKVLNKEYNGVSCLVGGCIRDICTNRTPNDFDFVTNISYDVLEQYFTDNCFTVKTTGKQFNVMNLIYPTGESFEIALYRKDGTYSDGRRPDDVSIGSLYSDAERRDFTINSLYFDISLGVLLDPTGKGIDDIHNRVLRFNGKASQRISEDYLRVIRAYRFMQKGFEASPNTLSTIRSKFAQAIQYTTSERIRDEIEKMVYI